MGQLKQTVIIPFALLLFLFMEIFDVLNCDFLTRFFRALGEKLIDIAFK